MAALALPAVAIAVLLDLAMPGEDPVRLAVSAAMNDLI
jgi:hypothetical protein